MKHLKLKTHQLPQLSNDAFVGAGTVIAQVGKSRHRPIPVPAFAKLKVTFKYYGGYATKNARNMYNSQEQITLTAAELLSLISIYNLVVRRFPTAVWECNLYPNMREGDELSVQKTKWGHSIIMSRRQRPITNIGGKWYAMPGNDTGTLLQQSVKTYGVHDTLEAAVLNAVNIIKAEAAEAQARLDSGITRIIDKEEAHRLHTKCRNAKGYIIDDYGQD